MSYILEALKKAEHQRDIGRIPGISSEHEPVVAAPSGRWKWVLVVVAVLGVNAVLLTFALWPRHPQPEQNTAAVAVPATGPAATNTKPRTTVPEPAPAVKQVVTPAVVAVAPPPKPEPTTALRPLPPLPQSVRSMPPALHDGSTVVPPKPKPVEVENNLPAALVAAGTAPGTPAREPAPVVKHAEPPTSVAVVAPPPTSASPLPRSVGSPQAVVHAAPKVVPATLEPDKTDANLPIWPRVSADLLRAINGGLHLDVHVYSKVPRGRLVLINMRRYNEGQQLKEGPVVDKISRDGVILSFRGQRFRLTQ